MRGLIDYLTGEACGIARKAVGQVEVLLGYLDERELTTRRMWRCAVEPNRKTLPAGNFHRLSGERFISNLQRTARFSVETPLDPRRCSLGVRVFDRRIDHIVHSAQVRSKAFHRFCCAEQRWNTDAAVLDRTTNLIDDKPNPPEM